MSERGEIAHEIAEPEAAPRIFRDVMLDIETMSLHPSRALILSMGFTQFDPTGDAPEVGRSLLLIPSIHEQFVLGRKVDEGTQKFWRDQPQAARNHWQFGTPQPISYCATTIKLFLDNTKTPADQLRLWANGIVFDIGNLETMLLDAGCDKPWHYRAPRDMRTICDVNPERRRISLDAEKQLVEGEWIEHHPFTDNAKQICRVWEHWPDESLHHHPV